MINEDNLHPTVLSPCCTGRVRVVEKNGRTDFICVKCGFLFESYNQVTAQPYPPEEVLTLVGLTRDEWDKMSNDIEGNQSSRYPVILGMLMKVYRRRIEERHESK